MMASVDEGVGGIHRSGASGSSSNGWTYEITNVIGDPAYGSAKKDLVRKLKGLVAESVGL